MSILTNPSAYLINVPELQNVVTSATGISGNSAYTTAQLQTMVDTTNRIVKTNVLQAYSGSNITVKSNINMSNAQIYYNNVPVLMSNGVNAANNLLFDVNSKEVARFTAAGYLGIGIQTPAYPLDVTGNAHVSGNVYATAFITPSDPKLKKDAVPYVSKGLPEPREFTWIASGQRDIGVFADDVLSVEPLCVERDKKGGLHVNYPKLVTLCLAELHTLRGRVSTLESMLKV